MTRSVLIIDDEPNMRWVLGRALERAGYTIHSAGGGDEGLGLLAREPIDLVLLDLKLKSEDGLGVLRRMRERWPEVLAIILTAYGTVPSAVEAMQLGATDFLRKPFDVEDVTFKVARALERRAMQQELARLVVAGRGALAFERLIGVDAAWRRMLTQAQQLAQTDHDVLVVGEAGSGRASIARAMHVASPRAAAPLVELDLEAYHSVAQAGALFGQGNGGAWAEAGSGSFVLRGLAAARGLYAALSERLNERRAGSGPRLLIVVGADDQWLAELIPARLQIPPLRERRGDILLLGRHFAGAHLITPLAGQILDHYQWPGNVTELRAVVERAVWLAGEGPIDLAHLPDYVQAAVSPTGTSLAHLPPEGVNLEQLEQTLIRQALERARGNKSKAAELLGLSRHTLLYRMEKYAISAPERG